MKHTGSCTALEPNGIWPYASGMTTDQGCATLSGNPMACGSKPECAWQLGNGQTPEAYDAQITSLGQQYSQYLDQRAIDCARFQGLGKDKDTCEAAKTHIADIDNTFTTMTNDLENDINRLDKKITSVDNRINELEKDNTFLSDKLSSALNIDAGAQGMFTDAQLLYNQDFVANWVLAIFLMGFIGFVLWTQRVSADSIKAQTQAFAEQASKTIPGITSMIPGM